LPALIPGPQEPHLLIRILQKAGSYASFSPMILVAVIPDIRVAALVAACVAVFNFLVATALRWRGVLKVGVGSHAHSFAAVATPWREKGLS
jgi:hypothetical protein